MSRFTLSWRFAIGVGSALMTGIVVTAMLAIQLRYTSASYDALLAQREVQHQDRARVMQVRFKTQVQEWKNLLLRGHKPEDFKKYHQSFKEEEATATRALSWVPFSLHTRRWARRTERRSTHSRQATVRTSPLPTRW